MGTEEPRLMFWTYHPSSFQITRNEPIDHSRGTMWKCYSKYAPRLWELLETNQYLWCCTRKENEFVRRLDGDVDLQGWEIFSPPARVICYMSNKQWDIIINDKEGGDWDRLISKQFIEQEFDVALLEYPLPEGAAKCTGPAILQYSPHVKQEAKQLLKIPFPEEDSALYNSIIGAIGS